MNTRSDTALAGSQGTIPTVVAKTRPFYWSVRRELWENRFVYIAPLAAAGVFLVGFLISIFLPAQMHALLQLHTSHAGDAILAPYDTISGLLMGAAILVTVFYCVDALYGERRDRSILFWKSLPVSDWTTVLAKAFIPFVVLPLLITAISLCSEFLMLLLSSVVLLVNGQSAAMLWAQLPVVRMSGLLLYHILTAHLLWPAPVYCWLLLVSCWARRAPFLWAALPPFAIAGLEKLVFHTSYFGTMVGRRFIGDMPAIDVAPKNIFPTDPMAHIMPGAFLASPGLWIGLALAAAFLLAAVRLRRYREPN